MKLAHQVIGVLILTALLLDTASAQLVPPAQDIDGNASQEMVISAIRRSDGVRRIHIKDYRSGSTTTNIESQRKAPGSC